MNLPPMGVDFDLFGEAIPDASVPAPGTGRRGDRDAAGLSGDQRRTLRQQTQVNAGVHPLTGGPLHPEASRDRDRTSSKSDPFTCGTCIHRRAFGAHGFPKCYLPNGFTGKPYPDRLTHSANTDVRAWWPACPAYQPPTPEVTTDV